MASCRVTILTPTLKQPRLFIVNNLQKRQLLLVQETMDIGEMSASRGFSNAISACEKCGRWEFALELLSVALPTKLLVGLDRTHPGSDDMMGINSHIHGYDGMFGEIPIVKQNIEAFSWKSS